METLWILGTPLSWKLVLSHSELTSPGTFRVKVMMRVGQFAVLVTTKVSPCTAISSASLKESRNGDCQCSLHPDVLSPGTLRTYKRMPYSYLLETLSWEFSSSLILRAAMATMVSPCRAIDRPN